MDNQESQLANLFLRRTIRLLNLDVELAVCLASSLDEPPPAFTPPLQDLLSRLPNNPHCHTFKKIVEMQDSREKLSSASKLFAILSVEEVTHDFYNPYSPTGRSYDTHLRYHPLPKRRLASPQ